MSNPKSVFLSWSMDGEIKRRELNEGEIIIGRHDEADLVIADKRISRKHAAVSFRDGAYQILDLGSSEGTRLNGQQLRDAEPQKLAPGDRIQIGRVEFRFDVPSEEPTSEKAEPSVKLAPMNRKLGEELADFRETITRCLAEHLPDSRVNGVAAQMDRGLEQLRGFIEAKFREYEVLQEITQSLFPILDVRKLLSTALELVSGAIGADRGFIILYDPRHGELRSMIPRHFSREDSTARDFDFTFSRTIANSCFENREIIIIGDALQDERFASSHSILASSIRSVVCIPLQKGEETSGVIYLDNLGEPNVFHEHQTAFLEAFSAQTALALENARLYTQAVTDSLTGLYNRKFINERIFEEMVRARRYQRDCSLILLDIDHFKAINDTHGHNVGDQVIERVSDILRENARNSDVVARYGGEEFLMLLTETDLQGAKTLAERVRQAIETAEITVAGNIVQMTISSGVASYRDGFQNKLAAFVAEADKALYRAKEGGRNRVCLAEPRP